MKKKFWGPAIASFFMVGLGQLIKGEGKKALKLILVYYFVLPSAIYIALILNAHLFLIVLGLALIAGLIIWLYSIKDALTHEALV